MKLSSKAGDFPPLILFSVSPNGIIYAKQHLRRSLLAKMLSEILDTRVMVKQGMKAAKGDKVSVGNWSM